MKEIKHIFFDLDHTLWDFDKNSELAFLSIFEKNKIRIDLLDFIKAYNPINLKYWELYRNDQISQADLRFYRLKECFDNLDFKVEAEMINILAEDYIEALPVNNHLLDGAKELLEYLFPKYKLHIITNGFEKVQNIKLENAGIAHYFKTVTTSEKAGAKKPKPKIFNYALRESGAKIENSLMIGDNIEADIIGAQKIGMQAIHFDYYQFQSDIVSAPCTSIRHLSKLYQHL
ncbi:MAG TPA: YjjG family noncanonical pyrimidine nucleotidase [Salinimicrobium sp.]|nr:YjjG family noncanonical pyrimidine nucleotidase [Salinimicrobium sp.]